MSPHDPTTATLERPMNRIEIHVAKSDLNRALEEWHRPLEEKTTAGVIHHDIYDRWTNLNRAAQRLHLLQAQEVQR